MIWTSTERTLTCPYSMRQSVGSDRSSSRAAARTVSPAWLRRSRRYLPSCLLGTVDPACVSAMRPPSESYPAFQMKDIRIASERHPIVHCKNFIPGSVVQVSVPTFYLKPFRVVLHRLSIRWHASRYG